MLSRLDRLITQAMAAMDRDLGDQVKDVRGGQGGEWKYLLGKRLLAQKQYREAYESFVKSEEWLAERKGANDELVIAAVIRQAECQVRLGNRSIACQGYRRALSRMIERGDAGHPVAVAIGAWTAKWCR